MLKTACCSDRGGGGGEGEGENSGMQIRGSVLFFGSIRRSDVIFAQNRDLRY